ncbi:hypothetical protein B5F40_09820 [Gordonibacter sp. An230]|nr:hypothetical protein B5F40_09820 [Gordonibacter sp. An230]
MRASALSGPPLCGISRVILSLAARKGVGRSRKGRAACGLGSARIDVLRFGLQGQSLARTLGTEAAERFRRLRFCGAPAPLLVRYGEGRFVVKPWLTRPGIRLMPGRVSAVGRSEGRPMGRAPTKRRGDLRCGFAWPSPTSLGGA